MNDPLVDLATVPPVPLHAAVPAARATLAGAVADLLAIPDDALDRDWRWRPTDPGEVEVRYAAYRVHERLEAAAGSIEAARSANPGDPIGPAVPLLAAATVARWELRGVMEPLDAAAWDADPGGGEWTVRQTLGHIVSGQRSYGWFNAWYLHAGAREGEAVYPDDGFLPEEPTEEDEGAGTPAEVLARLDTVVDASLVASSALSDAAMTTGARWSGLPVTVAFRLGRYGSHIREHTIQVDKTLAMIGRRPTEVERIVRVVLASYGRLEATVVGRPAGELDRPLGRGRSAATELTAAVDDAVATAASVRAAIGA